MLRSNDNLRDNESILSCYQTDTDSKSEFERLHSNDSRSRQSQDEDETSNCDSSSSREILKDKPVKRSNIGNQLKQPSKKDSNDVAKLPIKLTLEQNRISLASSTLPVFDSENSESYVEQLAECFYKNKQRSDYKTKRKNKAKIMTQSIRILLSNATNVKDLSLSHSSEFSYKATIKSTLISGNVVTYCDVDCKILTNI